MTALVPSAFTLGLCRHWASLPNVRFGPRPIETAHFRGIRGKPSGEHMTKSELQQQFIAEFARLLREAPAGMRVYMRVGDLFKPAEVFNLENWRKDKDDVSSTET